MRTFLALVSLGAAFICGWLTQMYFLLRHDGWLWRASITAALLVYCVGAILTAERLLEGVWIERLLVAGACGAMIFGAAAVMSTVSAAHFEGFWLPVAAALFLQAGLTLLVFALPVARGFV